MTRVRFGLPTPGALVLAWAVIAALILAASRPAVAGAAEDVQALVERAAAHIQAVGRVRAFADISRPDGGFVIGELYVFCNAADGTVLANGGNPRLVGKSLAAVRDAEGKLPILEMNRIALTQGHGWHEYMWPNTVVGRVQRKNSYVVRIDDRTMCGGGYYEPDPP